MILGVEDAAHLTCSIKLFVGSWVWCYAATYGNARHSWDAAKHTRTPGHSGYTVFSTCWNPGLHPVQNWSYSNSSANDWSISDHLWHPSRWPSNRSPGMSYNYNCVNGVYFHLDVAGKTILCSYVRVTYWSQAASSEFIVKDTGNCSPRLMRCTVNQVALLNNYL